MDKVLYNLGVFFEKKEKFSEAIGYWRKLADEYPSSSLCGDALWHLAWNTYCQGNYTQALEAMETMEGKLPGSTFIPRILFWKGMIYESRKRYEEAYQNYHRVFHFFPFTYYGIQGQKRMDLVMKQYPQVMEKAGQIDYLADEKFKFDPYMLQVRTSEEIKQNCHYEKGTELLMLGLKEDAINEFEAFENVSELDLAMKFQVADLYMASDDIYRGLRTLMKIAYDERIYGKKIIPGEMIGKFYPCRFKDLILKYSREQDMDPGLVAAVILQESAFNPSATSRAGATGLMQLMPKTANWLSRTKGSQRITYRNLEVLHDPDTNISLGTRYLKMLLAAYPDREYLALASYNAGKSNVSRWLVTMGHYRQEEFMELIPFDETQQFVKSVIRNRDAFRRLGIFDQQ